VLIKFKTYWKLGLLNLIWVFIYRLALKTGVITKLFKIGRPVKGSFFINTHPKIDTSLDSIDLKVFGWVKYSKEMCPKWNKSIISKKIVDDEIQMLHWSKIFDFDLDIGDIKTVWELSRFDWLLFFSIEFLKTGNKSYLETMNLWLDDWSQYNPVNQGVNWKCGQEASIRVMHLCLTSFLLNQHL